MKLEIIVAAVILGFATAGAMADEQGKGVLVANVPEGCTITKKIVERDPKSQVITRLAVICRNEDGKEIGLETPRIYKEKLVPAEVLFVNNGDSDPQGEILVANFYPAGMAK